MNKFIAWAVNNSVAVNLMMLVFVMGGIIGYSNIAKQTNPPIAAQSIDIRVSYLGAAPVEVEERLTIPIEESLADLSGLKRIFSYSGEGFSSVTVQILDGHSLETALNEVKARVGAINNFPRHIEPPIIKQSERRQEVIAVGIAGSMSEAAMKEFARRVRGDLTRIEGVSQVTTQGTRPYEISIEVSEETLLKYHLTFDQIARAIRRTSVNMPAGYVDNAAGKIQIMTRGQAYKAEDFNNIVILKNQDGTKVLLKDIATVIDGFTENQFLSHLNGKDAVFLKVFSGEKPNVVTISNAVIEYVKKSQASLPEGAEMIIDYDNAAEFKSRITMLMSNGISGLALVFIGLMLFLTPRLAFWVTMGIIVSFLGTFFILPYTTVGLTMISMFAFILILGIVVDDAIIVGENIYRENQRGIFGKEAAIAGASKVVKPVIFSALTTMIFFAPMYFVPGETRQFTYIVPVIVVLTLIFSLIESLMMLPSHLRGGGAKKTSNKFIRTIMKPINIARRKADAFLKHVIHNYYVPTLDKALKNKFLTFSIFIGMFVIVVGGIQGGGYVGFAFQPKIPQDLIRASFTFPNGTPYATLKKAALALEKSGNAVVAEIEKEYPDAKIIKNVQAFANRGSASAYILLYPAESRHVDTDAVTKRWRELAPTFPDAKNIEFDSSFNSSSQGMRVRLTSSNSAQLEAAGKDLKEYLATYSAVYYVTDTADSAQSEAVLSIFDTAQNMKVSLSDLGTQVRQAFYGEEVQKIARGVDDVKVRLRLPRTDRETFDTLNAMRIKSADGMAVPFNTVGKVDYKTAYTGIRRIDRSRSLTILASIEESKIAQKKEIEKELEKEFFPKLKQKYPDINFGFSGGSTGEQEFMDSMMSGLAKGLVIIYILFAIAFKSYFKPFIIFTALPFGYMGAVLGHLFFGMNISIYSIMGILAAFGVVINDNLVLMDYIGRLRRQGYNTIKAVEAAAEERFRAIFLTSFTTFIGLIPLMLETSVQAQFLIPTVIALAFGVLFATVITLFLVPMLYISFSNARKHIYRWAGKTVPTYDTSITAE